MRKADKTPETPEERHIKTVKVEAVRLAIRKEPSLTADAVGYAVRGEKLEAIGEPKGEWTKVRGGYVMSEFVS